MRKTEYRQMVVFAFIIAIAILISFPSFSLAYEFPQVCTLEKIGEAKRINICTESDIACDYGVCMKINASYCTGSKWVWSRPNYNYGGYEVTGAEEYMLYGWIHGNYSVDSSLRLVMEQSAVN